MLSFLSTLLVGALCTLFQCELGINPPYIFTNPSDSPLFRRSRLLEFDTHRQGRRDDNSSPIVSTTLGPVKGFKMRIGGTKEVFAFTGVPYGETTGGSNRFRDPVPKRPWHGKLWDATFPSPMCFQSTPFAGNLYRGTEECLHLDIFTPRLPKNDSGPLYPVFV